MNSETSIPDDDLLLLEEDEPLPGHEAAPWRVLIVDDERDVHEATQLALRDVIVEGRRLEFLHAYSAAQARQLLAELGQSLAVILLDVVMESPDAGLKLVRTIRDDLQLGFVRIILRTGQPGYAPEIDSIRLYDINDYKNKSELTRTRLYTSLTVAVRSYSQLRQLEASRQGLEKIIAASTDLNHLQGLSLFAQGVVTQVCALLNIPADGLVCAYGREREVPFVIAAAGHYAGFVNSPVTRLPEVAIRDTIAQCMALRRHLIGALTCLYFPVERGDGFVVCISPTRPLSPVDQRLHEVFGSNIAVGFANVVLTDEMRELAFNDPLLQIANRNRFVQFIDRQMQTPAGQTLALVDIDDFAALNVTLDQHYGDDVLMAVRDRLQLYAGDRLSIGRVSGDVFGLLGPATLVSPEAVAGLFEQPFAVRNESLRLSATSGFARLDGRKANGNELLKDASIALKQAKLFSRGKALEFSEGLRDSAENRVRMLTGLRSAFSEDRLFVVYQPQVDLQTGQPIGAEALLRWRNEQGQFVPPDQFIRVAEQSGLMVPIGDWVLRTAAAQLRQMLQAGGPRLRMAINVSHVQFREPAFVSSVEALVNEYQLPPELLEVELTESVAADDLDNVVAKLQRLRALGVQVALDDFGTGYSSLSILHSLPIDRVKIDRSFVNQVTEPGSAGQSIADLVVTIGRKMRTVAIAEGVETEAQRQALVQMGCQEGQGYLFAKPMPADALIDWVRQRTQR